MAGSARNVTHSPSTAEQCLLDAVEREEVADFSTKPDAERQLDAGFLLGLISGEHGPLNRPLHIRGARIVGSLQAPMSVRGGRRVALLFRDCHFDSPVDVSGGEFLVLRFVDCRLPAFIGANVRIGADLDLSGSQLSGVSGYESDLSHVGSCAVHLNNARIGGKLDLSSTANSRFEATCTVRLDGARIDGDVSLAGALLDGDGAAALSARSVQVGNNFDIFTTCGYRFDATGEVILAAAVIAGDLDASGARLYNPAGRALHCEDLEVESVYLTSSRDPDLHFEASGRINFLTAIVDGGFFLTNARLAPGPDYEGLLKKGGPVAVNLTQARISNALAVRNLRASGDDEAPIQGWFLMNGMQATSILDNTETGWPAPGYLDLDGATYVRCYHVDGGDVVTKRSAWLRRQFPNGVPDATRFRPQPYEQLGQVLRQHGQSQEANAIAVEKIRMRLAARIDRPWARRFSRLLMLVSQYGYSSNRAVVSFLVFVLLGSTMYATALFVFDQPFMPVELDPAPVTYALPFGIAVKDVAQGCPGLDVINYALDAAMPVIDLSQDLRCRFTPEGPWRSLWLLLHSLYVVGGAALSAVVVLTLTGVLRDE